MKVPVPIVTLILVAASVAVASSPEFGSRVIYDRQAILGGEIWRLFTGSFAHYSISHLVWDNAVLLVAGAVLELRRIPGFLLLSLVAPMAIGAALFLGRPEVEFYGGASGVAVGAVTLLARSSPRRPGVAILGAVILKLALDLCARTPVLAQFDEGPVAVSPTSHFVGAVCAVVISFFGVARPQRELARRLSDAIRSAE